MGKKRKGKPIKTHQNITNTWSFPFLNYHYGNDRFFHFYSLSNCMDEFQRKTLLRYNCQSLGQCELCQKLLPLLLSSRRHPKNCNIQMQTSVQIQLTLTLLHC